MDIDPLLSAVSAHVVRAKQVEQALRRYLTRDQQAMNTPELVAQFGVRKCFCALCVDAMFALGENPESPLERMKR